MNSVENLMNELEAKGWLVDRVSALITFTREHIVIKAYLQYVSVTLGEFTTTSKPVSQFMTTSQRLDYLLNQVRRFAEMADSGDLAKMARWGFVQKEIDNCTWEQALNAPDEALLLIEKAVSMIPR